MAELSKMTRRAVLATVVAPWALPLRGSEPITYELLEKTYNECLQFGASEPNIAQPVAETDQIFVNHVGHMYKYVKKDGLYQWEVLNGL